MFGGDKWLFREIIFKLYILVDENLSYLKVGDLIDKEGVGIEYVFYG